MPQRLSRRTVVAGAAFVPISALTVRAQSSPLALTSAERAILEAFLDRLVPKDALGPGALDCGAANYIDQQLAGALAAEKSNFIAGLAAIDDYSRRTHDAAFTQLSPDKRDAVIAAMESGSAAGFANSRAVFTRMRRLTLEGMFSDPHYGGNTNFAGWDAIRYPGPRVAVAPEDQQLKTEAKPYRKSAWGNEHGR